MVYSTPRDSHSKFQMSSKFTDFNLDIDSYAAFDATSLRDLIINRLNDQNIFTDQVFQGSNLSSVIDIIAYSYHVLLYYLNKTSSETMFTDAVVYENMNRIVKLLNYKPVGYRTSTCVFGCTTTISDGFYTIPRYSFVDADGIIFSTREDIPFDAKTQQHIVTDASKYILYQGKYTEYPDYRASGEPFEVMNLAVGKDVQIDHHSIDVYVKSASTGVYSQWTETNSLFLESGESQSYELRLNENYRYEIKFGNDINGKKLNPDDVVSVYYIVSDATSGIIGPRKLNDRNLSLYTTNRFARIKSDIKQEQTNYLTIDQMTQITLNNDVTSSDPQQYETVDSIRQNAPGHFAHQNRLVTTADFENYIKTNFSNIITDVRAANNNTYINNHIKYLKDELSLANPVLESRILANHVTHATTETQNNIYLYVVPRLDSKTSVTKQSNFLSLAQKQSIRTGLQKVKSLGLEPVFIDPVYVAVDLSVDTGTGHTPAQLHIVRNPDIPRDIKQLQLEVVSIIQAYFKHSNTHLGQLVDISKIHNDILSVPGIESVYTSDGTSRVNGISVAVWNPVYTHDMNTYNQNFTLPHFKFPFLYDIEQFSSRVVVDV